MWFKTVFFVCFWLGAEESNNRSGGNSKNQLGDNIKGLDLNYENNYPAKVLNTATLKIQNLFDGPK